MRGNSSMKSCFFNLEEKFKEEVAVPFQLSRWNADMIYGTFRRSFLFVRWIFMHGALKVSLLWSASGSRKRFCLNEQYWLFLQGGTKKSYPTRCVCIKSLIYADADQLRVIQSVNSRDNFARSLFSSVRDGNVRCGLITRLHSRKLIYLSFYSFVLLQAGVARGRYRRARRVVSTECGWKYPL